jgi:hypothetical protein
MPISKLQSIARAEPISTLRPNALPLPPDPAPDDIVFVRVEIVVKAVVVDILAAVAARGRGFVFTASTRKSSLGTAGILDM